MFIIHGRVNVTQISIEMLWRYDFDSWEHSETFSLFFSSNIMIIGKHKIMCIHNFLLNLINTIAMQSYGTYTSFRKINMWLTKMQFLGENLNYFYMVVQEFFRFANSVEINEKTCFENCVGYTSSHRGSSFELLKID